MGIIIRSAGSGGGGGEELFSITTAAEWANYDVADTGSTVEATTSWDGSSNAQRIIPRGAGPNIGHGPFPISGTRTKIVFGMGIRWNSGFPAIAKEALVSGSFKPLIFQRVTDAPGTDGDARMILQMRKFDGEGAFPDDLLHVYLNNNVSVSAYGCCACNRRSATRTSSTVLTHATDHHFICGDQVVYTTTGTPIGGLTPGETYFVISPMPTYPDLTIPTTPDFSLAATPEDAVAGNAITLSSAGTGTHLFTRTQALLVEGNTDKTFYLRIVLDIPNLIFKLYVTSEDGVYNQVTATGSGAANQAFQINTSAGNVVWDEQPCNDLLLNTGKIIAGTSSWDAVIAFYYECVPGEDWTQDGGNTGYFVHDIPVRINTDESGVPVPPGFVS